jgi:hypothetical protein
MILEMNKIIQISLYVLGLMVLISFYLIYARNNKLISELRHANLNTQEKVFYLENTVVKGYQISSVKLDKEQELLRKDRVVHLQSCIRGNELFCYFPGFLCGKCNRDVLLEFTKYINRIGSDNIFVIVPADDLDEFVMLNDEYDLNLKRFYGLKSSSLNGVPRFDQNVPMLFQINKDFRIQNVFFPDKENINLFSTYLLWLIDSRTEL